MRPRAALSSLKPLLLALAGSGALALLTQCASTPVHPTPDLPAPVGVGHVSTPAAPAAVPSVALASPSPSALPSAAPPPTADSPTAPAEADPAPVPEEHCASAPKLLADGSVPPAPPHAPLGEEVDVPGDRPVYVLPGNAGDARVIIYLHGMCGDSTAADFFREAARAHGTLIALRGDTPCENGRFKWRADPSTIQSRIRAAFKRVNALRNSELDLDRALLFGYSQGAERAERVAALYPKQYPRVVLGGPPTKASAQRLAHAKRVAIFGGELETTENMRAGFDALVSAHITARFFTLDCAYHGYFGSSAESQLAELLDWVTVSE
jgi:pimeloyl-ACP methyl ester carboxylesterase